MIEMLIALAATVAIFCAGLWVGKSCHLNLVLLLHRLKSDYDSESSRVNLCLNADDDLVLLVPSIDGTHIVIKLEGDDFAKPTRAVYKQITESMEHLQALTEQMIAEAQSEIAKQDEEQ